MQLVQQGQLFSFNYTDGAQRDDLYVAFKVYDITTSPVLVTTVIGVNTQFGGYVGTFEPEANKIYAIIGLVFTDNSYVYPDETAGQYSDIFQVIPSSGIVSNFYFCYSSLDYSSSLNMQATVYKLNTGSPVLMGTSAMTFLAFGTYFGKFVGTSGSTYCVWQVVYTDGTFSTPFLDYAPGSDQFDALNFSGSNINPGSNLLVGRVADYNFLLGIVED